jgi:hypothetical protein
MFVQTLLLALTEQGLSSCVEVSVVGYPEIVRAELDIPEDLSILSGLAVGYEDPDFAANKLKISREPIGKNAVFRSTPRHWQSGREGACRKNIHPVEIERAVHAAADWIAQHRALDGPII